MRKIKKHSTSIVEMKINLYTVYTINSIYFFVDYLHASVFILDTFTPKLDGLISQLIEIQHKNPETAICDIYTHAHTLDLLLKKWKCLIYAIYKLFYLMQCQSVLNKTNSI